MAGLSWHHPSKVASRRRHSLAPLAIFSVLAAAVLAAHSAMAGETFVAPQSSAHSLVGRRWLLGSAIAASAAIMPSPASAASSSAVVDAQPGTALAEDEVTSWSSRPEKLKMDGKGEIKLDGNQQMDPLVKTREGSGLDSEALTTDEKPQPRLRRDRALRLRGVGKSLQSLRDELLDA